MYSPWGKIQSKETTVRCFSFVTTAGHGGVMVSEGFAKDNFSEAAMKKGIKHGKYFCYEEDSRFAIAYLELINKFPEQWKKVKFKDTNTVDELKSKLIHYISSYDADYLLEIGIQPVEPEYTDYLNWKEYNQLKAEKNPDMIVSAVRMNDTTATRESYTKVQTADNREFVVTSNSYATCFKSNNQLVKLLSKCTLVGA